MKTPLTARGVTLIEVMAAMVVVAIASLGSIMTILSASNELRDGQLRVYASILADARIQRMRLQDKAALFTASIVSGTLPDAAPAIAAAPWAMDPLPASGVDFSTGALFNVLPDGTVGRCDATSAPACAVVPANCADAVIPRGVYCREVVVTRGSSVAAPGGVVMAGTQVATLWVRVSRMGVHRDLAIVSRGVIAQ